MKWWAVLFCGCAAFGAETRQEHGKRVVEEALQALGGEAYLHMQNRVETGRAYSLYRQQITGLSVATIYSHYLPPVAGQVSVLERQSFGRMRPRVGYEEDSAVLFNQEGAWEITFRGARPLEDQRIARYRDSTLRSILYILRERLKEPEMTFYSQGSDFFENRPVEIVDITDAENFTVTVSFDQLTKLPSRQVYRRRNPEYKDFDTEETVFGNWRAVGEGIKWPCSLVRKRNGDMVFEMYSDEVKVNQNLKDSLFTLPTSLKLLPKAK